MPTNLHCFNTSPTTGRSESFGKMTTREAKIAAANAALATIEGNGPAVWQAIAAAVANLNNKDANAAIGRWLASPRGPRRWRSVQEAIWVERQRLRWHGRQQDTNPLRYREPGTPPDQAPPLPANAYRPPGAMPPELQQSTQAPPLQPTPPPEPAVSQEPPQQPRPKLVAQSENSAVQLA
jgi:hypothetical protein